MTLVIDYGVGNLFSLRRSLEFLGEEAVVSGDPAALRSAERVILPGVGAFGDAAALLKSRGLDAAVRDYAKSGRPLLGICLGMQLLFDGSEEFGWHDGLGLLPGRVTALKPALTAAGYDYKVPQMGWNALRLTRPESPLWRFTKDGDAVYFVHSFAATDCADCLLADTEYGVAVTAAAGKENVFGCQFHPEKSGRVGLAILKAFTQVQPL